MSELIFKTATMDDKIWIKEIFSNFFSLGSESSFGGIFIWGDVYGLKVCRYKDFLLRKFAENDKDYFLFPAGNGDLEACLNTLIEYSRKSGGKITFIGLTKNNLEQIENIFPEKFEFLEERDKEDYIYNAYDLINLKGRKYHSKRNHISKFNRLYEWQFEEISELNIEACKDFCNKWFLENEDDKRSDIVFEKMAIKKALDNYKELELVGGVIKVEGKIVSLTCGEKINKYTFDIRFEKALKSYEGAYAVINNEFAKRYLNNFSYINREEDLGIPGLRKVKLSYHPAALLKRYRAVLR